MSGAGPLCSPSHLLEPAERWFQTQTPQRPTTSHIILVTARFIIWVGTGAYAKRVDGDAVSRYHVPKLPGRQCSLISVVPLGEHVLKGLGNEAALSVVGARVGTMLGLMHATNEQPEPRVGKIRVRKSRRIRKAGVDDEHGEERKCEAEAELSEAAIRMPEVDLAVAVSVPEEDMLLQHRLYSKG